MKIPTLKYSPEVIGKGLTRERLGGICYFSICGAGETLLPKETIEIVRRLLENGHFVNVTTNGTISKHIDNLIDLEPELRSRLHIAFSLHYLELKRLNLLDCFWENVNRVKDAGISILVQINLCDEYIPYWDEIKAMCINKVGAAPQVAATRKEISLNDRIELLTELGPEQYKTIGNQFDSPLFDFTMNNFNVRQTGFCYAGDWSGVLNLGTGVLSRCYGSTIQQDIFQNIDKPIKFCAMGRHCKSRFCMNSSHFLSLGVIPSQCTPTYAELRNRSCAKWYTDTVNEFLSTKLQDSNEEYGKWQMMKSELYNAIETRNNVIALAKRMVKAIVRQEGK